MIESRGLTLMFVAAALILVACASDGDAPPPSSPNGKSNLLLNGGFESGEDPWYSLSDSPDAGFVVTDARALVGSFSALERMRDPASAVGAGPTNSKVYYLVQDILTSEFPDVVRGNYFVENWVKGTRFQYLQFVIIAFSPTNFPAEQTNWQIRYPLGGIDSQPFAIGNAKYRFVSRGEPILGQWVPFQLPVKNDFKELWGNVPEGFEKIRLLFEVRWDHKQSGSGEASADVFWDELYAGRE